MLLELSIYVLFVCEALGEHQDGWPNKQRESNHCSAYMQKANKSERAPSNMFGYKKAVESCVFFICQN